jgi:hypothetical protein
LCNALGIDANQSMRTAYVRHPKVGLPYHSELVKLIDAEPKLLLSLPKLFGMSRTADDIRTMQWVGEKADRQ